MLYQREGKTVFLPGGMGGKGDWGMGDGGGDLQLEHAECWNQKRDMCDTCL